MSRPRKSIKFITLGVLLLAAAGGVVWSVWPPSPPAVDEAQAERDRREMAKLVELKDSSLAALENRDFRTAEPNLLELATVGIGEPIGSAQPADQPDFVDRHDRRIETAKRLRRGRRTGPDCTRPGI